ncbi:hypothetical protein MMC27_005843 [Xylographa pallens]|nr:hypothetical protein [Xylographa pallens]
MHLRDLNPTRSFWPWLLLGCAGIACLVTAFCTFSPHQGSAPAYNVSIDAAPAPTPTINIRSPPHETLYIIRGDRVDRLAWYSGADEQQYEVELKEWFGEHMGPRQEIRGSKVRMILDPRDPRD